MPTMPPPPVNDWQDVPPKTSYRINPNKPIDYDSLAKQNGGKPDVFDRAADPGDWQDVPPGDVFDQAAALARQKPAPQSNLSKFGGGLYDSTVGAAKALYGQATAGMDTKDTPALSGERAEQELHNTTQGASNIAHMIGSAVRSQWDQFGRAGADLSGAVDQAKQGNYMNAAETAASGAEHSLAGAVPLAGPVAANIADTATGNLTPGKPPNSAQADPARAAGMALGNAALAATPAAVEEAAPGIAEALPKVAKATKGAIKGGIKGALEPVSRGSLAGAATGALAGEMLRPLAGEYAAPVSAIIGGAAPMIIRGAVKGAKEALYGPAPGPKPMMPPPPVTFPPAATEATPTTMPPPPVTFREPPSSAPRTMPPPPVSFRGPSGATAGVMPPPSAWAAPTATVTPAQASVGTGPLAPKGSVVIPPAEGIPERYGAIGGQFGTKMAADAFAKDQAVAGYLRSQGITETELRRAVASNPQLLKTWAKATDPKYKGINPDRIEDLVTQLNSVPAQ